MSARFTGGGFTVDGVLAESGKPGTADLNVTVPADASGTTSLSVRASGPGGSDRLDLTVRVSTAAGGNVNLAASYPSLRGAASATFPFDVTLRNDTPRAMTFALSGQGPTGWTVDVRPSGSSQATSLPVTAGSTGGISVSVTPAADAAAGTYPIIVVADGGGTPAQLQLAVIITGSCTMTLSTPDQVLSTNASAGQGKPFQLVVTNTGSGALSNVVVTATPATGWTVTFDPVSIPSIDPGKNVTVTATITPASNAVAGDYNVSFRAAATETSDAQTIRVTVDTSLSWALVGGALIVLVLLGLGWVFSKYGRR